MPDLLRSADVIVRAMLEEASDFAIFLVDPNGRIATWSTGAATIFGYAPEEVIGRRFDLLFTQTDREAGAPQFELAAARERGRADDTRWHLRKDGSRIFADGVTTLVPDDDGGIAGYAKILRDVTERYRIERRLAAQLALTNILNEQQPFETAAGRILEAICTNLDWDVAVLWRVTEGATVQCVRTWAIAEMQSDAVRNLCDADRLEAGVGLPGRVVTTRQPAWIRDFPAETTFPRAPLAAAAGLRAAVAFPIIHEGKVTGVMEFFSREVREPDQALMPVMALVGAQIGDFIEQHRHAAALRESEERYRIVSETAQDAIFTMDEESRILFCNPAVERVFGYKPQELIGESLYTLIPERYREAHRRGVERYLATGRRNIPWTGVELPGLHRNGHEIPLEISFGSWEEGESTVFTGFARNIADRKRALEEEQKARAEAEAARGQLERRADEEASFRHLASALTGAVEMTDVLYEITSRATVVTRADGVYVERIIGPNRMVEVVSASGRGTPKRGTRVGYPGSMTEEIMKKREPVILADMSEFGASMAPYLMETCSRCEVLVTPLIAEDDTLGALVLLNSKTSGRRFGDADILRARTLGDLTSLALRRVRLMEQEREAREAAERALRVRDETLGIVSHDLRNPLTKISLSAELLDGATAEEQKELIATIRSSAQQAQRLIQDLLDVARVEAGRFSVQTALLDVESLVTSICESHEPLAAQKQQKIVCDIESPLPQICADRDRLLQLFGNLVGNAIKFTPERGVVTISARVEGNRILFRVSDTGPGIPETDLRNVFQPYWQAKKTAHMGAGLGLAIVRGIVEAHGGQVWASNLTGGGAEFLFTIPAEPEVANHSASPRDPASFRTDDASRGERGE